MKFEKREIITAVDADKVKKGDQGWFANTPAHLEQVVWGGDVETVRQIHGRDTDRRFEKEDGTSWGLFYPTPYKLQQKLWVDGNNIRVGDRVKVVDYWEKGKKGFAYGRNFHDPKEFKKKDFKGEIVEINDYYLKVRIDGYSYNWRVPYYALKVIKETYQSRQAGWVEKNILKIGDTVQVTRGWEPREEGFTYFQNSVEVGEVGKVRQIDHDGILCDSGKTNLCRVYPYFAIKKIAPIEKFRSFRGAEEFDNYAFNTFTDGRGFYFWVNEWTEEGVFIKGKFVNWEDFKNNYTFTGREGSPAGVKNE